MSEILEVPDIQKVVQKIGYEYGADRVFLFGSYARGEATSDSDVDLRIDRGKIKGLSMGSFLLDVEEALGKKVDLLSTKCLDEDFLAAIRGEEILLYARSGL